MLNKILQIRLTDNLLKLILMGSVVLVSISLLLLWTRIIVLENKWFEIAKKKEVVIMDETGNVWQKKMYGNQQEITVLFSISFIKNTLSYNYKNYNKVYKYIKNITSKESINQKIKKTIEEDLKQIKIINGEYSVSIDNYKIKQVSGKEYEGVYLIKHFLNSETTKLTKNLLINMKVTLEAPTNNNSSGYFISDFDIRKYDSEKDAKIFSNEN